MKDPKLSVDEDASDFVRHWLLAARAEEPPPDLVHKIERALGLGTDTRKATPPGPGVPRDQIALINGARTALAVGSPALALALLERHRILHPDGMLRPEALAMHIEAIDQTGDHARARALALAFLAEHPDSPLAQRVAQLGRE